MMNRDSHGIIIFIAFSVSVLFLIIEFAFAAPPEISIFKEGDDIVGIIKSFRSGEITLTDGRKFFVNRNAALVKMDGKQSLFSNEAIASLGMVKLVADQIGENLVIIKIIEIGGF